MLELGHVVAMFPSLAITKLDVFLFLENVFIEPKTHIGSGAPLTNGGF